MRLPPGRWRTLIITLATAPALLSPAIYAVLRTPACSLDELQTVRVAVTPELGPTVTAAAGRVRTARCVRITVTRESPEVTSRTLAGDGVPGEEGSPDVWMPDSSVWTVRDGLSGPSIAQSPLVIAMPTAMRAQGPSPTWSDLLSKTLGGDPRPLHGAKLRFPDPDRDAAGVGIIALARTLLSTRTQLTSVIGGMHKRISPDGFVTGTATVASERAVWLHNTGGQTPQITAVYPAEGTLVFDYPYAVLSEEPAKKAAAAQLLAELRTPRTGQELRESGLRSTDGQAPASFAPSTGVIGGVPRTLLPLGPVEVQADLKTWHTLVRGMRLLTLLDVSGSMAKEVAPGVSRLEATTRLARTDLGLLPDDTESGLWTFATHLTGDQDWSEKVPVGPLDQPLGSHTRRAVLDSRLAALRPSHGGGTALYASLLAAFRSMQSSYRPDLTNTVLILTDGRDDDPDGPGLAKAIKELKAAHNALRPVDVVVIGLGPGVAAKDLRRLVRPVGGQVYTVRNPKEAGQYLVKLLSRSLG